MNAKLGLLADDALAAGMDAREVHEYIRGIAEIEGRYEERVQKRVYHSGYAVGLYDGIGFGSAATLWWADLRGPAWAMLTAMVTVKGMVAVWRWLQSRKGNNEESIRA